MPWTPSKNKKISGFWFVCVVVVVVYFLSLALACYVQMALSKENITDQLPPLPSLPSIF